MKVALILSGQPRNIPFGYDFFQNTLLSHYDVDVFAHTWFDPNNLSTQSVIPGRQHLSLDPNAINYISELYKPKELLVELPKTWTEMCEFTDKVFTNAHTWADQANIIPQAKVYSSNITHSMFYSIMMSNLLKEQYAVENDIKYDVVIRGRFDCAPHNILNLNDVDFSNDVYYYQELFQPDGMVSDWFGMGSPTVMNYYASLYFNIYHLVKQSNEIDGYWCNELLLKHHLLNGKIKSQPIDCGVCF